MLRIGLYAHEMVWIGATFGPAVGGRYDGGYANE